jgi:heterodisulfide reductase subunit B
MNLDAFQGQMNGYFKTEYKMPVLFFTQLMGIAFGEKPDDLGFGSELVSAREAMSRIGVETPKSAELAPEVRKKSSSSLPMPSHEGVVSGKAVKAERKRIHENKK